MGAGTGKQDTVKEGTAVYRRPAGRILASLLDDCGAVAPQLPASCPRACDASRAVLKPAWTGKCC